MRSKTSLHLIAMALAMLSATAHREINLVAGESVQIPEKDKTLETSDKKTILCRTAVVTGTQAGRDPNKPFPGAVCHNEKMLEGDKLATLTAGGEFTWGILADKLGSGHDGGHCSWWVSDGTDQKKWYKFNDDIDCTKNEKVGDQPGKVKIPKNLPLSCKDACTIMWLWSPLHTAKCEIYSNCFDVKINGVAGGIEDNYPMKTAPFDCIRVNPETHKTSAFGQFINVGDDGSMSLEKVVDGDPKCYQYTVRSGDALDEVRAKFDFSADDLYQKNKKVMKDADTLPAVGTKLVIAGCDKTPKPETPGPDGSVAAAGSTYVSALTVLGVLASLF